MRSFLLVLLVLCVGCGSSPTAPPTPPPPTPEPPPACQVNHTATVAFKNTASRSTHTVILDGITVATLTPGQESRVFTEAANVTHSVEFRITNTTRRACSIANPIWAICSNHRMTCSGD